MNEDRIGGTKRGVSLRATAPILDKDVGPAREVREHADLIMAGGRLLVDVTVPRTEIKGRMRLLSRAEAIEVTSQTRRYFVELGLPGEPATLAAAGFLSEWNAEIAARHLAIAVRDPKDAAFPLASLEDWRDCDDDQIGALWQDYQDRVELLDPLAEGVRLSDADREAIESAAGKSEASLLMPFGSRRLALYAISTVARPAS